MAMLSPTTNESAGIASYGLSLFSSCAPTVMGGAYAGRRNVRLSLAVLAPEVATAEINRGRSACRRSGTTVSSETPPPPARVTVVIQSM